MDPKSIEQMLADAAQKAARTATEALVKSKLKKKLPLIQPAAKKAAEDAEISQARINKISEASLHQAQPVQKAS